MKIEATSDPKGQGKFGKRTAAVERDLGGDLPSMVALFGESAVFGYALDAVVVKIQAKGRGVLDKGGDIDTAEEAMRSFDPKTGKSSAEPSTEFLLAKLRRAGLGEEDLRKAGELLAHLDAKK